MDLCPSGRAPAVTLASWERTSDSRKDFKNPAIAGQSRGFCFFDAKPERKEKHEQKQNTGADKVRP
jgi:hypothetical protein